jgi:hypothetical protein
VQKYAFDQNLFLHHAGLRFYPLRKPKPLDQTSHVCLQYNSHLRPFRNAYHDLNGRVDEREPHCEVFDQAEHGFADSIGYFSLDRARQKKQFGTVENQLDDTRPSPLQAHRQHTENKHKTELKHSRQNYRR